MINRNRYYVFSTLYNSTRYNIYDIIEPAMTKIYMYLR